MARREVIWAETARVDLRETLEFYNQRNGNTKYGKKILHLINRKINQINAFPNSGKPTNDNKSRVLIFESFMLFYEIQGDKIHITSFWNTYRNPDSRIDNKSSDI